MTAFEDALYRAIGERIARQRDDRGLTQHDLALRTERAISRSAIANIEVGRQRIAVHHVYQIAAALDVPPQSLLPDPKALPIGQDHGPTVSADHSAQAFIEEMTSDKPSAFSEADPSSEAP